MPVDNESLKRVLMRIKEFAHGAKSDGMRERLKPPPPPLEEKPEDLANPLDAKPDDPMAEPAGLGEGIESPQKENDEEMTLQKIRELLARV